MSMDAVIETFSKVKIDLILPLLIIFALQRTRNLFYFPLMILRGLKFFVTKRIIDQFMPPKVSKNTSNSTTDDKISSTDGDKESVIDKMMAEMQIGMVQIDGTLRRGKLISTLLLFDSYESSVYIGISALLIHIWTSFYHCYIPSAPFSPWIVILTAVATILPCRHSLRILLLTDSSAQESQTARLVGVMVFAIVAFVLIQPFDILGYDLDQVISSTSIHFNALFYHIFIFPAPQYNVTVIAIVIKACLAFISAVVTASMVIPAMRYSQTFYTINFGLKYEIGLLRNRMLLIVDLMFPLFIAFLMTPNGIWLHLLTKHIFKIESISNKELSSTTIGSNDNGDCNNSFNDNLSSNMYNPYLLGLQLFAIFIMIIIRLVCMRLHMQCFMDAVVRNISVEIATLVGTGGQTSDTDKANIQVCYADIV